MPRDYLTLRVGGVKWRIAVKEILLNLDPHVCQRYRISVGVIFMLIDCLDGDGTAPRATQEMFSTKHSRP